MPTGVYIRTEETKKRMSEAQKGNKNNLGKKFSEEWRMKISNSLKGRNLSEETKRKIGKANKGNKHSNDAKIKIGINSKGNKYNLGRRMSEETKSKISKSMKKYIKINGHPGIGKHSYEQRKILSNKLKGKIGSDALHWKGGISKEEYGIEFTEELKSKIKRRDNYTCQKCGRKPKNIKDRFACHHIDYIKRNSIEKNLITLCFRCNLEVNKNRKYWKKFFRRIMKKKGYTYHFC